MIVVVHWRLIAAIEAVGAVVWLSGARVVGRAGGWNEGRLAQIAIAGPVVARIIAALAESMLIRSVLIETPLIWTVLIGAAPVVSMLEIAAMIPVCAIVAAVPAIRTAPTAVGARAAVWKAPVGYRVAVRVVTGVIEENGLTEPVESPGEPAERETLKGVETEAKRVLNG